MVVRLASRSSRSVSQPPVPVPQTAGPPAEGGSRPLPRGMSPSTLGTMGWVRKPPGGQSPAPVGPRAAPAGSQRRPGRGQATEAGFWEGPAGGLCFHL